MPIRARVRRFSRGLKLAIHLTVQTPTDIAWSLVDVRRKRNSRPVVMRREFVKIVRYFVGFAIDNRDSSSIDDDFNGRRPSQLPPHIRRERRAFVDRRRRRLTMLLDALGDAAQTVLARLARQGRFNGCEPHDGLIEAYLPIRLQHRDPHVLYELEIRS